MSKARRTDVMAAYLPCGGAGVQTRVRRRLLVGTGYWRYEPERGERWDRGRTHDYRRGRGSTPQHVSRGVADLRRPHDDPLVSGDVLPAAAADRQRARPLLQPDRIDPDLPVRGRRA